jgi:hypothetical protein
MEICLSRSCYVGGPDDGCLLPRLERQPVGEKNKVISLKSNILSLLLSALTIIFRHKDPCVMDTGMFSLNKIGADLNLVFRSYGSVSTWRIGIRYSFKHDRFGSAVTDHCGSVSARVTIIKVWICATVTFAIN